MLGEYEGRRGDLGEGHCSIANKARNPTTSIGRGSVSKAWTVIPPTALSAGRSSLVVQLETDSIIVCRPSSSRSTMASEKEG